MKRIILFSFLGSKILKEFVSFLTGYCICHLGNKMFSIRIEAEELWDIDWKAQIEKSRTLASNLRSACINGQVTWTLCFLFSPFTDCK